MGKYIHAFWHIEGTSYHKLSKIGGYFGGFQWAWEKAELGDLKLAGLDEEFSKKVLEMRRKVDIQGSLEKLWLNDIFLVDRASAEFPEELKHIASIPWLLYRKGKSLNEIGNRVAIVGMRKCSVQGEKLAFGLARMLGNMGVSVVSGLAFGIDAAAHNGSLQSAGNTIGVLASGIGQITPSSHFNLAENILKKGGALISEYPVTGGALKHQFLERNRLIAGLAHTVVIVEAARRSGALITAKHGLEQGKEILAFPGDPGRLQGQGCNGLIKTGQAGLVDSIKDVTESLKDRGWIDAKDREHVGLLEMVEKEQGKLNWEIFDKEVLEMIRRERPSMDDVMDSGLSKEVGRERVIDSICKLELAGLIGKNSELKWQVSAD